MDGREGEKEVYGGEGGGRGGGADTSCFLPNNYCLIFMLCLQFYVALYFYVGVILHGLFIFLIFTGVIF